jgi:hypothetical protein
MFETRVDRLRFFRLAQKLGITVPGDPETISMFDRDVINIRKQMLKQLLPDSVVQVRDTLISCKLNDSDRLNAAENWASRFVAYPAELVPLCPITVESREVKRRGPNNNVFAWFWHGRQVFKQMTDTILHVEKLRALASYMDTYNPDEVNSFFNTHAELIERRDAVVRIINRARAVYDSFSLDSIDGLIRLAWFCDLQPRQRAELYAKVAWERERVEYFYNVYRSFSKIQYYLKGYSDQLLDVVSYTHPVFGVRRAELIVTNKTEEELIGSLKTFDDFITEVRGTYDTSQRDSNDIAEESAN